MISFHPRFTSALPQDPIQGAQRRSVQGALWSAVAPTPVANPRLIALSHDLLATLGIPLADAQHPDFIALFSGNALPPAAQPYASNYGGHQFGQWAGQLGDGRAIALGEVLGADGQWWTLQLKGAGETPYSRHADGRAVLRSSIREFLCSEAMHHLGIPTTRALTLIASGESVVRDMFYNGFPRAEPGAIVCRAAPSFLRFGHFELPASRGDHALLRRLADYCIDNDFPHLATHPERYAAWFADIAARTARLIGAWMRVGFVHGVLNTDNMSITGLTIDYGPYGWIEDYDPGFTPNTSDRLRRYRFGNQAAIALWNLTQLAQALAALFPTPDPLHAGLQIFTDTYAQSERENACRKLGLPDNHAAALPLMQRIHSWFFDAQVDMTLFFRALSEHPADSLTPDTFAHAYYREDKRLAHDAALRDWLDAYRAALRDSGENEAARRKRMLAANPRFILRNWLVQQAIEAAEQGDDRAVLTLLERLQTPYAAHPSDAQYVARRPDWAQDRAGCSMLSCSS